MNIQHYAFPAPQDLSMYMNGFWYTVVEGPSNQLTPVQCCLPSGSWEVIFSLTDERFRIQAAGNKGLWMPRISGVSTNGKPVFWQAEGGTRAFGLVLMPETMELLTQCPASFRSNFYEDISKLNIPIFDLLYKTVKDTSTPGELADKVFGVLRSALQQNKEEIERHYFSEAMRIIRSSAFTPSLDDLSEQVFVSKRQLQRAFQDKLGFGPKAYSRILRFRDAILYMKMNPEMRMTDIAYDFGYSDQSHFIREFKDFTGQNPRAFFSNWNPIFNSTHFNIHEHGKFHSSN